MQEVSIIIDNRERNVEVIEGISNNAVKVTFAQLPVGDYIISDRICVERKTISDFENSIMDSRLFEQVERLRASFEKPILLVEGSESEFRLNKNVITGSILKLYIDHNIQVILSHDAAETAYILSKFAEREQVKDERRPKLLGRKKAYTQYQWQLLILSSIPGIGPKLANDLLEHFKTIKNVATAEIEELKKVKKIGKKKAEKIYEVLNLEFKIE